MGPAKFEGLVGACRPGEAMDVCIAQSEKCEDVLVLNVDFGMFDGQVCPRAGLPRAVEVNVEDPELFSNCFLDYAKDGLLGSVGGWRGTLPSHIYVVVRKCGGVAPRWLIEKPRCPVVQLPGSELAFIGPWSGFRLSGERYNPMGSAKFEELVGACRPGEAADVCIAQSEKYDDVLDIHVDSGEIDG